MRDLRILAAEAVGTFILMLGGPGTAVLAGEGAGLLGIALGFGFALLIAAYAIGPISGCHINPAVTVGMAVMKKIEVAKVPAYIVGQALGAAVGGLFILLIRRGQFDEFDATPASFATNLWGENNGFYNFGAMVLVEIVLTAILVLVVLSTTRKSFPPAAIGLAVGITLTVIHLISIPVDNTSVNPARSFGMAIFAGGDAMEQLWAFIVFPILGAILGVLVFLAIDDADLEDSLLGTSGMTRARDAVSSVGDRVDSGLGAAGAALGGDGPYGAGSRGPSADGAMPNGFPIKGNVDSMLYHREDSRSYGATVAEVWFDSPQSAEAAGFSLASTHPS